MTHLPVLSADAVRAAESAFPNLLRDGTLMQRAATAVATECLTLLRDHGGVVGRHALLLVGPGDNGGDALFAGARLASRGVAVYALPLGSHVHDAGLAALRSAGGRVVDMEGALALFDRLDLVIDGIVGLGSVRGLDGDGAVMARAVDDAQLFTLAIDVPSGVHTDTGAVAGVAIAADVTITFGALRRAHVLAPAALQCGEVLIADIGVPMHSEDAAVTAVGQWFAPPASDADKFARGVVGIVTGSAQYAGAAVLSVEAAARSGCGMVRYFGGARDAVVVRHPEAVVADVPDIPSARCQAWLVGCGLGLDAAAEAAVASVLARPEPVVIDADALTLIANREPLLDLVRARAAHSRLTLLTPHAGELTRLTVALGVHADIEADRLGATKAVASALGCLVLLKGPSTLVTDGRVFRVTPLLGARLATAGSGDVLGGIIAGATARWSAAGALCAADLMELAAAAAIRHAEAAGASDTTASDLIAGLDASISTTMEQ